jgi:hypothetical protein
MTQHSSLIVPQVHACHSVFEPLGGPPLIERRLAQEEQNPRLKNLSRYWLFLKLVLRLPRRLVEK